ncbi:hypothetical protein AB0M79_01430 [Polymorphospora sp. NPDC051019]|uniref:hypothetical protein n=1 Tax=Polymorphospora sp. NPDC051019 TaxID=3155725 RepID=UPI003416C8E2
MSHEFDAALAAVGPRLHELRRRRGVTLTALSETTDFDTHLPRTLQRQGPLPARESVIP